MMVRVQKKTIEQLRTRRINEDLMVRKANRDSVETGEMIKNKRLYEKRDSYDKAVRREGITRSNKSEKNC